MVKQVVTTDKFTWLDLVNPTPEELQQIALDYGLHVTSVEDCLDPIHQPKYERIEDIVFIILRVYDEKCQPETSSVFNITRKIAIFYGEKFLITVHRCEMGFINDLMKKWQAKADNTPREQNILLFDLIKRAVFSYAPALEQLEFSIEQFEDKIFSNENTPAIIKEVHGFRTRVSTIRRIFRQSYDALLKIDDYDEKSSPIFYDIRERLERYISLTDALREASNNILNTQISLASHRTNSVIRILTLFSAFFLPLTFIVGIYGMNFEYMPELRWKYGYPLLWLIMSGITSGIFLWFRKRRWL